MKMFNRSVETVCISFLQGVTQLYTTSETSQTYLLWPPSALGV